MCADTSFHADQARRYIGEPRFHLATRPLLPQHDGAARIVAHDVERVLADIDADHGDRGIGCLRHSVLLVFGAPCQLRLLAGQEHGRTIPLADLGRTYRRRYRSSQWEGEAGLPPITTGIRSICASIASPLTTISTMTSYSLGGS